MRHAESKDLLCKKWLKHTSRNDRRNGKMTYVHQVRNCLRAKITKKKRRNAVLQRRENRLTLVTCKDAIQFGIVLFAV